MSGDKPTACIIWGTIASGKSTMARKFCSDNPGYVELNRDNIRFGGYFPATKWSEWKWKDEDVVTEIWEDQLDHYISKRKYVVISDTNLSTDRRLKLLDYLWDNGYVADTILTYCSLEEAIRRDSVREDPVGEEAIVRQHERLLREKGWLAHWGYYFDTEGKHGQFIHADSFTPW